MSLTTYTFSNCIAGFFEIAIEDARRLLPSRFTPLEVCYGRGVLVVNVYHFSESEVGPYDEVVYAIMTLPRLVDGVVPNGAVFPFQVATSTQAAREHAIERWHLPHWPEDIRVEYQDEGERMIAKAWAGGTEIMKLQVNARAWQKKVLLFQSFMQDQDGTYMANIKYDGETSEHEEGTALISLTLDHPYNAPLAEADIDDLAFREIWQRGVQTFQPLTTLS